MAGGRADGVTETEWRALPSEVERRQIGDVTHGAEHLALPFGLERGLQFSHAVEMIFERLLVGAGDDHDVVDAGCDSLFDNPLDRRAVDHREHLLRHRLGGRKEAGAEPRSRDHRRSDTRGHQGILLMHRRERCIPTFIPLLRPEPGVVECSTDDE